MRVLNSFELKVLINELRKIKGSKISKIYHPEKDELDFEIFHTALKKQILRIISGRALFLSKYKQDMPLYPSHFCMFLRKYLTNAVITNIEQKGFERVVELTLEKANSKYYLILELFSKGNVILCDSEHKIIIPLIMVAFDYRTIKAREIYKLPPSSGSDIITLSLESFERTIRKSEKQDIVRCLASDFSLGSAYSEEILLRAAIEKNTPLDNLLPKDIEVIYSNLMGIINDIRNLNIKPCAVFSKNEVIDFVPFEMKSYEGYRKKTFESFNDCLDYVFSGWFEENIQLEKQKKFDDKLEQLERRLLEQKTVIEESEKQRSESKARAELIYHNLSTIETILSTIITSRRSNMPWQELKRLLKEDQDKDIYEANLIKEIKEDEGLIVLNFNNGLELEFMISATDNANKLFEQAKKLESKIEGAQKSMLETQQKIAALNEKKEELTLVKDAERPKEITRKKQEWYYSFRWFKTSKGRLVIAGREATQNEILIKKYLDVADLVFHADIYGSPFAILKNGRNAEKQELEEVASFVAAYSSAWKSKIPCDVYYVSPSQVSKQAPTGEYIARGAFMIYGKKNYFRALALKTSIGFSLKDNAAEVISGPEQALKTYCRMIINLVPGDEKSSDAAKEVLKIFKYKEGEIVDNFSVDDIIRLLPVGGLKIERI